MCVFSSLLFGNGSKEGEEKELTSKRYPRSAAEGGGEERERRWRGLTCGQTIDDDDDEGWMVVTRKETPKRGGDVEIGWARARRERARSERSARTGRGGGDALSDA